MFKTINYLFLLNLCIYCFICQDTGTKLKGTPISSDSSSSLNNAFDDNLSTEFRSSQGNGWIGLQLSSPHVITKIGWAQNGEKSSYFLGLFEGANEQNFMDAIPLYMITEEGKKGVMNYVTVKNTQSFKYIRYIGPNQKNSVIAGFEVYGEESSGDVEPENIYQPTNLPLVVVYTENNQIPNDKEVKLPCNAVIIKDGKINAKGTAKFKLRGNSTMNTEKKAFTIKFSEKTNVLDFPAKAKKWVLLANAYDKTLLRNMLGFEVSRLFGLKYSVKCEHVDVILNGNFMGNYMLCDQIDVNEGRVELTEMDETSIKEPEVTGGYLIEGDNFATSERSFFKTSGGIVFAIKYPDEDDIKPEQSQYITKKFNSVEAEINQNNLASIDFESFTKYFLIEEFCANIDSIWSSFYITKERNDEKLYFGPTWDFDLAFDNDMFLYPTNDKTNFAFKYQYSNGNLQELLMKMLSNSELLQAIKKRWGEMTRTTFTTQVLLKFIDEQVKIINDSQKLNFIRWDVMGKKEFLQPVVRASYEEEINYLKSFVEKRMEALDKIISSANKDSVNAAVQGGWGDMGGMGGMGGGWGGGMGGGWGGWGNWGGFGN